MNWFLDHGADPNGRCSRDFTPLSTAVESAPFPVILKLIERGENIAQSQLLHHAALRELPDRIDVMKFLLDSDSENKESDSINHVMYQDNLNDYLSNMYSGIGTPLQFAAGKGSLDLVVLLIDRGADPLVKDPMGKTAVDWASRRGHTNFIDFLNPLLVPSSPRQDFVDGPGLHFKATPLEHFFRSLRENGKL